MSVKYFEMQSQGLVSIKNTPRGEVYERDVTPRFLIGDFKIVP